MSWVRHKTIIIVAAVVVLAALVAGALLALRGGGQVRRVTATPSHSQQLRSPFTGEPVPSLNRVLAAKIDNIVYARPQTGLTLADIVYVLPVEGGLSRFLAIFSSHYPPVIGPVRSAREDDLQLLRQFGRPAFAYSGATAALLPYIQRTARIVDLYAGTVGGYYRDDRRVAPYNLYAHTRVLLAQAHGAGKAGGIGFRFGLVPAGGKVIKSASVSYPAASFRFTWSAAKGGWLVSMDGAAAVTTDGGRLAPATVVIQHTTVRTSRFLEYGKPPPFAESTGSGTALVLRNGKEWLAHWSRPAAGGGTTFITASGQPMTFARGQVWVVLAYRQQRLSPGAETIPGLVAYRYDAPLFFASAENIRRRARGLLPVVCFLAGERVDDRHHSIHSEGQANRDRDEVPKGQTAVYWSTRPSGSQLGAWASAQSTVVTSPAALDAAFAEVERRFADAGQIPVPPHWGGWRIRPQTVEFWQGRPNRMHDRLVYDHSGGEWRLKRLAP